MKAKSDQGEFSPDGKRIVTASDDKTARIWDAQSGKPLTEPLKHDDGKNGTVYVYGIGTVWSPGREPKHDGVVETRTDRSDKTARIWDAKAASAHRALEA